MILDQYPTKAVILLYLTFQQFQFWVFYTLTTVVTYDCKFLHQEKHPFVKDKRRQKAKRQLFLDFHYKCFKFLNFFFKILFAVVVYGKLSYTVAVIEINLRNARARADTHTHTNMFTLNMFGPQMNKVDTCDVSYCACRKVLNVRTCGIYLLIYHMYKNNIKLWFVKQSLWSIMVLLDSIPANYICN